MSIEVNVSVDWLKQVHRDLDACQKVIWLAGCRPQVPNGFDPSYVTDAQARLKEIEARIATAPAPAKSSVVGGLDVSKDRFETELPAMPDDLHNAIQRAAAELPAGWEIRLSVEHEGGGVELLDEDGNQVDFPSNHERLVDTVNDAIAAALAASQGEGGPA